jgi:hypothetical protein
MSDKTAQIRALNDAMRRGERSDLGKLVITAGARHAVAAWPLGEVLLYEHVKQFDDFNEDNDLWGERDFGSFQVAGETFNWKISYYDNKYEYGTEHPEDPAQCRRVLTIMLASEY